jgi:hypothetical protein
MAAYAGLAAFSGHLSPLARGPLLDGIGPPQAYRWVNPPPDLAATNQPPAVGEFHIPLDPKGSRPEVFVTSDNQVTIVVPSKAVADQEGQIEVLLSVDPVDPATLASPGKDVTVFGNAYQLTASYQPSGDPASLALPMDLILLYPVTTNLHAATHLLFTSPEGTAWQEQEGSDSLAAQQAEGPVPELGYVLVGGKGGASLSVSPAGGGGGGPNTVAIALIVAAACLGLVGIGLLLRGRDGR